VRALIQSHERVWKKKGNREARELVGKASRSSAYAGIVPLELPAQERIRGSKLIEEKGLYQPMGVQDNKPDGAQRSNSFNVLFRHITVA